MMTLLERFSRMVLTPREPNGCWIWTGPLDQGGYGKFLIEKRTVGGHRASWLIYVGTLEPVRLDVCHRCDNRRCVNPAHLFRGTRSENMKDAFAKGRIRRSGVDSPARRVDADRRTGDSREAGRGSHPGEHRSRIRGDSHVDPPHRAAEDLGLYPRLR